MEACGGSHFMARKLAELGHFQKLVSPQFVCPFVKTNKNDFVEKDLESQLKRKLDEDEVGKRLLSITCVGTLTASTISTEIGVGKQYGSSRDFAAATGLVPRWYSTGGRTTLLGISKRGNKKIRTLLVQCARVFIQKLEHQSGKSDD